MTESASDRVQGNSAASRSGAAPEGGRGGEEAEAAFGARVIAQEADALQVLAGSLGDSFAAAVDCLYNIKGRIAVTGMGKSGHVGRKVAATMASTGSPAFFIHPAEAGHGDLGMLTGQDAVLAFSNSGRTEELVCIMRYAALHGLPLVAVTHDAQSDLGSKATVCLVLPDFPEADPFDCAPTTSCVLQMAMGDALALALMRRRGCTRENFHQFHPSGSLGRRLKTVAEIMHVGDEIPIAVPSALMSDVILLMTSKGFGVVGIVEGGRLVGIITDGDLRRNMCSDLLWKTAGEVMHVHPITVAGNNLVDHALHLMNERNVSVLFVVDGDTPVGVLHIHDCLRAGGA